MTTSSKLAPRILVAEDERAIAEICRRVLASEGFEVDVAANGKTAQRMARHNRYDLSLIDIKMPIMSGDKFFHWLQKKQPRLASRVVFTTGDVIGQGTETFLEESGRPFLPKPFTPDELRSLVRQVGVECQCLV
jgi:DNA-binding response OmpR family regulator